MYRPEKLFLIAFISLSKVALIASPSSNEFASLQQKNDSVSIRLWEEIKESVQQNETSEGLRLTDTAISIAEKYQDLRQLALLYNAQGILYKKQEKFLKSLEAYGQSLIYKRSLGDTLEIAKTLQNIGNVYRQMNMPDSAISYFETSLQFKQRTANSLSQAKTRLNLGNYYFDLGEMSLAIAQYKETLLLIEKSNDVTLRANTLNNLGNCYQNLGLYSLSNSYYFGALQLYNSLENMNQASNTLYNIAITYVKLKNYEEAFGFFSKAKEIYKTIQYNNGIQLVDINFADIYLFQNKPEKALIILKSILKEDDANLSKEILSSIYLGLGRAYTQLSQFELATSNLNLSIALKSEIKDNLGLGRAYNNMAIMYFMSSNYEGALSTYFKVQSIATSSQALELMSASTLGISEVYEVTGKLDSSYFYFKRYKTLKDSLFSIEKSKQIIALREKYEADRKDERISSLEYEYKLSEIQNERNVALLSQQKSEQKLYLIGGFALMLVLVALFILYRQRLTISQIKVAEELKRHKEEVNDLINIQEKKALEAMVEGKDIERKRIANELHDHFGSLMATVKMNLNSIENLEIPVVQNSTVLISQMCDDIRNLAHELNVGISADFGLLAAIKELTGILNQSGRIEVIPI